MRLVVALAGLAVVAAACTGGGSSAPAPTTTPLTADSPTTTTSTAVARSTSSSGVPTTPAPPPDCRGVDVETPGIVALSAADGSACWSALSDWNAQAAAVTEGRLLVVGRSCSAAEATTTVAALETASGRELWRASVGATGGDLRTTLGTGAGVVLITGADGVVALDTATGNERWRRPGAAVAADGPDLAVVVDGEATSTLVVVDRATGTDRATIEVDGEPAGVAADERVVLVSTGSMTVVHDALTGALLGGLPLSPASDTAAVRLVAGVATGVTGTEPSPNSTRAYDAATGEALWTHPGYPPQRPEPTDGNVYVVVDAGVAALDPRTGDTRWTVEGADLEAGPGLALAWTGTLDGPFEAVDPLTGAVRWSLRADEAGLPLPDTPTPSGYTVALQSVLPSADGVFFGYGNCLGS